MSATLRWTCPMLTAGSMLTARRYPAPDRMGGGLVLPKVVQGGSAADPPAPSRRPLYGPHGGAPFNAASASRPRTTGSPVILVMTEHLLSRTGRTAASSTDTTTG